MRFGRCRSWEREQKAVSRRFMKSVYSSELINNIVEMTNLLDKRFPISESIERFLLFHKFKFSSCVCFVLSLLIQTTTWRELCKILKCFIIQITFWEFFCRSRSRHDSEELAQFWGCWSTNSISFRLTEADGCDAFAVLMRLLRACMHDSVHRRNDFRSIQSRTECLSVNFSFRQRRKVSL